jgi:hypothetical protein
MRNFAPGHPVDRTRGNDLEHDRNGLFPKHRFTPGNAVFASAWPERIQRVAFPGKLDSVPER